MSRSSKRKPKKRTFFDERDSENDENSNNNIDALGFNKGKEGNYDKEDDREHANNNGLGLLANLENIAYSVTKTGGEDPVGPGQEGGNVADDHPCKGSLDEELKHDSKDDFKIKTFEFSVLSKEEFPNTNESSKKENKVSEAAAAVIGESVKNSNCGCKEAFLEGGERCKEKCQNRKENRDCECAPPCSNMRVQKMREGETAPLVKVDDDRLVTTRSVPAEVFLGELTGEILTKEEMATRLEEYKAAGSYSRVWKIGLNLRMDTEPLQKPGSDFRLAKHSCVPNARVKEWEVAGVPCLVVVANRALDENEEVTLDLGYQLEVLGATKKCDCGSDGCRLLLGSTVTTVHNSWCCSCQVVLSAGVVPLHPFLGLPSCADCRQKMLALDLEKSDREVVCMCCGRDDQAALFPCSICPASFCKSCLAKSLGKPKLSTSWRCLLCCSLPLQNIKLSLINNFSGNQEAKQVAERGNARGRGSDVRARGRGLPVVQARGRASPRAPLLRPMMIRPAGMRPPRSKGGLGPRLAGLPGPRTPLSKNIRPQMWRPMQPSLLAVQNATSTSLLSIGISQPSQLEAVVTESSEEPVSDPLALEEPAPALTFQTASPSSFTPSDTSANSNHQLENTPAKRPRMMSSGFQASPNPRTPPGPRVWRSPAPTPSPQRLGLPASVVRPAGRPLVRAVSRPHQQKPLKVEVITVEEDEEEQNLEYTQALRKLQSSSAITVERSGKEALEKKAHTISEVMSNVAYKLAREGGAQLVRGDVNVAKKMLDELSKRLEL